MKSWKQACQDALLAGGAAGIASMAGMAVRSRRENGSGWASLNAPSHWLWGEKALRQDAASLRYTLTGFLIHHLSAGFWGVLHERLLGRRDGGKPLPAVVRDAALTTAVAAVVDFGLVPQRLTPGFQRRLSLPSLVLVYGLFAAGLAAGSHLAGRRRGR